MQNYDNICDNSFFDNVAIYLGLFRIFSSIFSTICRLSAAIFLTMLIVHLHIIHEKSLSNNVRQTLL